MGDHSRFKVSAKHQPGQKHHITKMKAFIAIFALLSALAVTRAFELVSSATAGLSVPLLAVGGASTGTTAAAVIPTITAIAGGAITLKAHGLLLSSAGRSKRSTDEEDGLTFAFIAQSDFDTAAEVGKALKNVDACEIRYSCPFKGEQI